MPTLSLVLIVDIDQPTQGGVVGSQRPMEDVLRFMAAQPPSSFDRWRAPGEGMDDYSPRRPR